MGFDKCLADECLLKKETKRGTIIVCVYIDDTLYVGDQGAINEFKQEISLYFAIKEEGEMKEYVGCKVERRGRDNLIMFQDDLINKIEKIFGDKVKNMQCERTFKSNGWSHIGKYEEHVKNNQICVRYQE